MRILLLPLLAAAVVSWAQQQPATGPIEAPSNLSIPVQLDTTIKADKAHAGDVVRFNTIEAVLVSKGVVMPQHAKLYGHVLGAAPKQGQTPSWISVVVERAEWKEHALPLHAFISGQVYPDEYSPNGASPTNSVGMTPAGSHEIHTGKQGPSLADPQSAIAVAREQAAAAWGGESALPLHPVLHDVKLARHKSGKTFLFSEKHNLKLPSGMLLMLQNEPPEGTVALKPAATPEQK